MTAADVAVSGTGPAANGHNGQECAVDTALMAWEPRGTTAWRFVGHQTTSSTNSTSRVASAEGERDWLLDNPEPSRRQPFAVRNGHTHRCIRGAAGNIPSFAAEHVPFILRFNSDAFEFTGIQTAAIVGPPAIAAVTREANQNDIGFRVAYFMDSTNCFSATG